MNLIIGILVNRKKRNVIYNFLPELSKMIMSIINTKIFIIHFIIIFIIIFTIIFIIFIIIFEIQALKIKNLNLFLLQVIGN